MHIRNQQQRIIIVGRNTLNQRHFVYDLWRNAY